MIEMVSSKSLKIEMKKPRISLASFLSLDISMGLMLLWFWNDLPREFCYSVGMMVIFSILGQIGEISKTSPVDALKAVKNALEFIKAKNLPPGNILSEIESFIVLAIEHWNDFWETTQRNQQYLAGDRPDDKQP